MGSRTGKVGTLLAFSAVLACSSSTTTTGNSTSGGTSSGSPASGTAAGKLGSTSFSLGGGMFYVKDGKTNILLSSFADTCGRVAAKTSPPGGMLVEIYDIPGTSVGEYVAGRLMGFQLKDSCPAGAAIDESQLSFKQSGVKKGVKISKMDSQVLEGTLDLAFEDGSMVTGTFSIPVCASLPSDGVTCAN